MGPQHVHLQLALRDLRWCPQVSPVGASHHPPPSALLPTCPSVLSTYFPAGSSSQLQPTMSVSTMNLRAEGQGTPVDTRPIRTRGPRAAEGHRAEARVRQGLGGRSVPNLKVNVGLIGGEAGSAQAWHTDALLQEAAGRGHQARQGQCDAKEWGWAAAMVPEHACGQR